MSTILSKGRQTEHSCFTRTFMCLEQVIYWDSFNSLREAFQSKNGETLESHVSVGKSSKLEIKQRPSSRGYQRLKKIMTHFHLMRTNRFYQLLY